MAKSKPVIVVQAGSGKNVEVEIRPGETAKDLLEKLGFDGRDEVPQGGAAFSCES